MRSPSNFGTTYLVRTGIPFLAILISIMAGTSGLIFQSALSQLIVLGAVLGVLLLFVVVRRPTWALYAAIFATFLPQQVVKLLPITFLANYLIVLIMLLAGCSWLFYAIIHRHRFVWKSTIFLMLVFVVWSIITLFWATDLNSGRQCLIVQLIGLSLVVLVVNQIGSAKALNGMLGSLALVGWILALAGLGTILSVGYIPGTRLNVLGINENKYGIQLLLAMLGVLWQAIRPDGRHRLLKRLVTSMFLMLTIGLIALSGSRGSAISLIITLLAFCFWRPTRVWGLIGLIALAVGSLLTPLIFSTTLERFAIPRGDTLFGGREALWQATWNLILDHIWLGVGIGNARHAVIPYVLVLRSVGESESAATHNPVLQVWAETGLLGIFLYLSVLGSAVWLFVRQYVLCRMFSMRVLVLYFALVSSTFLGYMASWIKGGGLEFDFTYFLLLSLLLIPLTMDFRGLENATLNEALITSKHIPV